MVRKSKLVTICLAASMTISSCDYEIVHNGQLDGYWKLHRVDTLDTGGTTDLSEQSIFWSVQANLLSLRDNNQPDLGEYVCRFDHTDNHLLLYAPHRYDKQQGDNPVTDSRCLHPFGVNSLHADFIIEQLSSSRMQLSDSIVRLHFRHF